MTSYAGAYGAQTKHSTRSGKVMKGKVPLTLVLAAAGAAGVYLLMKPKQDVVTGRSGKSWRVVLLGNTGGVKTYEIFTPAGAFGPHGELSVLRYSQMGADMNSRKVVGVGAGVPAEIMTVAASDFGVPFDASKVLAPGTSG